jgi:hypothetical protein
VAVVAGMMQPVAAVAVAYSLIQHRYFQRQLVIQ